MFPSIHARLAWFERLSTEQVAQSLREALPTSSKLRQSRLHPVLLLRLLGTDCRAVTAPCHQRWFPVLAVERLPQAPGRLSPRASLWRGFWGCFPRAQNWAVFSCFG